VCDRIGYFQAAALLTSDNILVAHCVCAFCPSTRLAKMTMILPPKIGFLEKLHMIGVVLGSGE
jgi:hypothetical protein